VFSSNLKISSISFNFHFRYYGTLLFRAVKRTVLSRTQPFSSTIPVFYVPSSSVLLSTPSHPFPFALQPESLVGTALWLRWSCRICSPPESNKSAPLHIPAPQPLIDSLPPPKSMHPRPVLVTRPSCLVATLLPRTRACVSLRFALLDHVRMSSPTALTRFTLERLLCRGARRRNTHVYTACPGTIIAMDSSWVFFDSEEISLRDSQFTSYE